MLSSYVCLSMFYFIQDVIRRFIFSFCICLAISYVFFKGIVFFLLKKKKKKKKSIFLLFNMYVIQLLFNLFVQGQL